MIGWVAAAAGAGTLLLVSAATRKALAQDPPIPSPIGTKFPDGIGAREAFILEAIRNGNYGVDWATVTNQANGHTATFTVCAQPLRIAGVRVNATADTQQRIADAIGCMLPTPKIMDLKWLQRVATLTPILHSSTDHDIQVMATTARMLLYSGEIDAALSALGNPSGIIGPIWKSWGIGATLARHPNGDVAQNYGGFFVGQTFDGSHWEACVTNRCRLIQGQGWKHGKNHTDYSQLVDLVKLACVVDGQPMDLRDVLASAELWPLACHDGPLTVFRQPGVPLAA